MNHSVGIKSAKGLSRGAEMPEGLKPLHLFIGITALTLLSGFVTSIGFLDHGTLFWDTYKYFGLFRDSMQSINYFGEYPWWSPHIQTGFPSYYLGMLTENFGPSPLFVLVGGACYLLGRAHVYLHSYLGLYVFYYAFLQVFVYLWAVYAFASQICSRRMTICFVLILAAFSPGVLANVTDIGLLEPSAFSLLFCAAYIRFLRRKSVSDFWRLAFASCLLALQLDFEFVVGIFFAVSAFILITSFVSLRKLSLPILAFRSVRPRDWLLALTLAGVCAAPHLFVLSQEGDTSVRSTIGTSSYGYYDLEKGNPLEVFAASLPSFGFNWDSADYATRKWALQRAEGQYVGYTYLGLLAIPLLVIGLLYASALKRTHLFLILAFLFGSACLSAYSPLSGVLFRFFPFLQRANHLSDLGYRAGGYLVILFGAGLGFEAFLKDPKRVGPPLLKVAALSSAIGIAYYWAGLRTNFAVDEKLGLILFLNFCLGICLVSVIRSRRRFQRLLAVGCLLFVIFLDVSSEAFDKTRWMFTVGGPVAEDEAPDHVNLAVGDSYLHPNTMLVNRYAHELSLRGISLSVMAEFGFYRSARASSTIAADDAALRGAAMGASQPLLLGIDTSNQGEFQPFLNAADSSPPASATVNVLSRSYNHSSLSVDAAEPVLLLIRNTYSPYWHAKVDGREVPVARAFYLFKAIALPAGKSTVELAFRPPWVALSIAFAYLALFGLGLWCAYLAGLLPRSLLEWDLKRPHR